MSNIIPTKQQPSFFSPWVGCLAQRAAASAAHRNLSVAASRTAPLHGGASSKAVLAGSTSQALLLPRMRSQFAAEPPLAQVVRKKSSFSKGAAAGGENKEVDVLIIGGGVTGSALLYELATFTDLKSVHLLERRSDFARVASGPNNNSQTIHCGDIETNYTVEKAASVKLFADMLRNYATKLPGGLCDNTVRRMQKMAIGVGEKECEFMENRFESFKKLFPKMQLLNKKQIAEVEPWVAYKDVASKTLRSEKVVANYVAGEHAAVDYYNLTKSFIHLAENAPHSKKDVKAHLGVEMLSIDRNDDGSYRVVTNAGIYKAKFVVVSACGHSLLTAHRLGYGHHLSCLPVAGSFYFTPEILRGKVYTVQNPELPFAAAHGDPDLVADNKTRFGPTALPMPVLERYNMATMWDFFEVIRPNWALATVYLNLFKSKSIRNYMIRNVLYEVPGINRRLFLRDVQKVCPGLQLKDLTYAKGFGGVRPQLIDKNQRKLLLGEGKLSHPEDRIIFNVTPSPGGTTCIGNGEIDMRAIMKELGGEINENKFKATLLEGEYPTLRPVNI